MRILVASVAGAGHTFPLIPLTRSLIEQGHEVVFATSKSMHDTVAGAGIEVVDAGIEVGEAIGRVLAERGLAEPPAGPDAFNALGGVAFGRVLAGAFAEDLIPRLAAHPVDLVIAEAGSFGATLAAHRTGTPCVVHAVSRRLTGRGPFEEPMVGAFVELAAEYGVEIPADGTLLAHRYLNTFPAALDLVGTPPSPPAQPVRTTPWNPPVATRPTRPHADRPWVYLTFGTAFGTADVLNAVAAAVTELDVDVLVAAGAVDAGSLGSVGERVRVEAFVPQSELIGEFSLVVHHGGSGTTLAAAAHAVPQVVLPFGADQLGNADAVAAAGIGRRLDPAALDPAELTRVVAELLAEGPHRDAARRVAAEIAAMPTPAQLAENVESWARP